MRERARGSALGRASARKTDGETERAEMLRRFGERERERKRQSERGREKSSRGAREEHTNGGSASSVTNDTRTRGEAQDVRLRRMERHAERFMCGSVRVERDDSTPSYLEDGSVGERRTARERARRARTGRRN